MVMALVAAFCSHQAWSVKISSKLLSAMFAQRGSVNNFSPNIINPTIFLQIYELICELASFKKYSVICSMKPRILIIGLVWPEPTSSAAGWRMLQLIDQLLQWTDAIHFASAATKSTASYPLNK